MDLKFLERLIEGQKKAAEGKAAANIRAMMLPMLGELRKMSSVDTRYVDLIESQLEELASGFGSRLYTQRHRLTPKEIEICGLIKSGLRTKEIAALLKLSALTIITHRNNIRKKLGLQNKRFNLVSFLNKI